MKKYFINIFLTIILFTSCLYGQEVLSKFEDRNIAVSNEENRRIKDISTDGTLADNSNEVSPSEQAVKTFVETYLPSGTIVLWSGSEATIPSGWVLCDGTNSTPNLQNKFIMGAGDTYAVAATGGTKTISEAMLPAHNHAITVNNDTHNHSGSSGNQSASHTHTITGMGNSGEHGTVSGTLWNDTSSKATGNQNTSHSHTITINNDTHNHTATSANTGSGDDFINPYYALCYIQKT